MAGDRTQIKTALMDLLESVVFPTAVNGFTTWASASRRMKLFNNVDPSKQPALFLVQHKEEARESGRGLPVIRYLDMGAWCLAPTGDESVIGDNYLDYMLAGIESVLIPDDPQTNELTLGGLCTWCRIDRTNSMFVRDPGDIDGQALLVIPIRILMP